MPKAQELAQLLRRGARLQPVEVLQRIARLELCDLLWTLFHRPPTRVLQHAAILLASRTRLQGSRTTAYHARVISRWCGCSPTNLVANYRMHHLVRVCVVRFAPAAT
jgi:hypothetical protein